MSAVRKKRCVVAFATRERQYLWTVELPEEASVAEALDEARRRASETIDIPWGHVDVGIFGEACNRDYVPLDGDRIELYRALRQDPRHARRERVRQERSRKA